MLYVYVTTSRVLKKNIFEMKYYEMTKRVYLSLWASNQKNKTTLFPETLKFEENKVVLFFYLRPPDGFMSFFVLSKIPNFMSPFSY